MTRACLALAFLAIGSSAAAQSPPTAEEARRFAIGGGLFLAKAIFENGGALAPHARLRWNMTPRWALDLTPDFETGVGSGVFGLYQFQVHYAPAAPSRRVMGVFSFGTAGWFESRHVPELCRTLVTGDVAVYPAHRAGLLTAPVGGSIGGGVRVPAWSKAWIEVDTLFLLIEEVGPALVFTTSVVLPFGPRSGAR